MGLVMEYNSFGLADAIQLIIFLAIYIFRGIAYKSLLNTYKGFIPFFGDIVCKCIIADEYDNEYKKKYLFSCLVPIIITFIFIVCLMAVLLITGRPDGIILVIMIIFVILFAIVVNVLGIMCIYYTTKILTPLLRDITGEENVGVTSVVFSIIPFIFFIWLYFKSKNLKQRI